MPQTNYRAQHQDHSYQYDTYDGSEYGSTPSSRPASTAWRLNNNVVNGNGGGGYDGFDFGTSHVQSPPAPITVNTRMHDDNRDSISQHLLYENALLDCAHYEILDVEEVDVLKKELARITSRVQAAQRKLTLESKVKDAASNLHRLYALQRNRPDTPQRNDSRGSAKGMYGDQKKNARSSESIEHLLQAQTELAESLKKVDDLNETIKDLLEQRAEIERKLLSHTAAVLAEEANNRATSAVVGLTNGHHSMYVADEFDGLRDILRGVPADSVGKSRQQEEQMEQVQGRLEHLNLQLRDVIQVASRTLGKSVPAENSFDHFESSAERLENRFTRLEDSLNTLQHQQDDMRAHCARIQESEQQTRKSAEEHMQELNTQLYDALLRASDDQAPPGLNRPPPITGQGYTHQLQYMDSLVKQHDLVLQSSRGGDDSVKSQQRLTEYEDTVSGLWEILLSESPSPRLDGNEFGSLPPTTPFREPFTLQAFSSRVQHLFDRVHSAKEQQDILRRQIQQQRELNGKSDAEKDRQIEEMQLTHDRVSAERDQAHEELAKRIVEHQAAEGEASQLRSEHMNVMNEVDELKRSVEARQQERDTMSQTLQTHQSHIQQLDIATTARDAAEAKLADVQKDMEGLESEVIRLTTELTMAKADLDVAHGSRAERAGAAKAVEHTAQLERELQEMTNEFQAMTKESIEQEKEREQLDTLIDELRERVTALESQLSDEKLRWLGLKTPSGETPGADAPPRESMSMSVLRQEFKKMVRETRAEGVRLIRAEQEERRRLEAELRKIRQANSPLGRVNAQGLTNGALSPAAATAS